MRLLGIGMVAGGNPAGGRGCGVGWRVSIEDLVELVRDRVAEFLERVVDRLGLRRVGHAIEAGVELLDRGGVPEALELLPVTVEEGFGVIRDHCTGRRTRRWPWCTGCRRAGRRPRSRSSPRLGRRMVRNRLDAHRLDLERRSVGDGRKQGPSFQYLDGDPLQTPPPAESRGSHPCFTPVFRTLRAGSHRLRECPEVSSTRVPSGRFVPLRQFSIGIRASRLEGKQRLF